VTIDDDVDRLYELAPEAFVGARNDLVRALRAEKRRDEASAVAALRRPSAAAWALNQVARREPALVDRALEAGAALKAATDAAVAGDASALRTAASEDRAASDAAIDAAIAVLGRPDARQQVAATLRAAVLDDTVAEQLRRGVLTADHDASGFGFGSAAPAPKASRAAAKTAKSEKAATAPKASTASKLPKADRAAEQAAARAAAREAEERARDERRRRKAHEAELARLQQRVTRLAKAADRADAAAREAREAADRAVAELEAARAEG
jgi:hypothetical protein